MIDFSYHWAFPNDGTVEILKWFIWNRFYGCRAIEEKVKHMKIVKDAVIFGKTQLLVFCVEICRLATCMFPVNWIFYLMHFNKFLASESHVGLWNIQFNFENVMRFPVFVHLNNNARSKSNNSDKDYFDRLLNELSIKRWRNCVLHWIKPEYIYIYFRDRNFIYLTLETTKSILLGCALCMHYGLLFLLNDLWLEKHRSRN